VFFFPYNDPSNYSLEGEVKNMSKESLVDPRINLGETLDNARTALKKCKAHLPVEVEKWMCRSQVGRRLFIKWPLWRG